MKEGEGIGEHYETCMKNEQIHQIGLLAGLAASGVRDCMGKLGTNQTKQPTMK